MENAKNSFPGHLAARWVSRQNLRRVTLNAQHHTALASASSQEGKIFWVQKASRKGWCCGVLDWRGLSFLPLMSWTGNSNTAREDRRRNQGQCWFLTPPLSVWGFFRLYLQASLKGKDVHLRHTRKPLHWSSIAGVCFAITLAAVPIHS